MREPQLAIVVAMTDDRVIGCKNQIPWDMPEERLLFREMTFDNTVIMGSHTFQSLEKPLANRINIVLTKSPKSFPGAITCRSFFQSLVLGLRIGKPIYVIGGVGPYQMALSVADCLHISWIKGTFKGDRYFPELDRRNWLAEEKRVYEGFSYVRYRRHIKAVTQP
ncbi:MAG: dihydrofolate reductase [Deltaproteobacteria bacterium]|nr:dihydrofolate reductase [Deltaproteobacteria bacterium]